MSEAPARGSASPAGVIHDIGYQRYEGPRLGRRYAVRSLYVHSLRTAFGLGRSAKAKVFPWLVVSLIGAVAAVLAAIRAQSGQMLVPYVDFPEAITVLVLLFCAVVGPELVSRDLRGGVLPLYFSRPLRRGDYALAKLAALVTAVWLPLFGAQLLMFLGGAFTVDGLDAVWSEFGDFVPGVLYSGVHAVVFASLALLIASLAGRRAVAAGAVVAVFLATTPVVGVLSALGTETTRQLAALASPMTLVGGVGDWLFLPPGAGTDPARFGPLYGGAAVALVTVCVVLLLARYRRVAR
jgi:ABC-2 type transport system permease protein